MKSEPKIIGGDKLHAKFSASGSKRWLSCPGSMALCEGMPEQPESKYAAEGTQAHECLELLLKNHNQLAAVVNIAKKKYPLEMVEYAMDAVYWITDLLEAKPGADLLCETEVRLDFIEPGMFGTLDAAIVREFDRITVIDYKYGAGIGVNPTDENGDLNSQLAYYALGISKLHDHNFSDVELVIIQPRAFHEEGTIRTAVFTMEQLLAWERRFEVGVRRAKDPFAPLMAGDWCRFCPAAIKCPELKTNAMERAQIVFSEDAGLVSVPEPKMIVLPDLGVALDACTKLEAWIDRVREHALHVLGQGHTVEGWKLVQKRGVRRWIDEAKVSAAFGPDAYAKPKMLSPAQLEKLYPTVKENIQALTTTESSGYTIARADDKRQAVKPIDQIFGAIE